MIGGRRGLFVDLLRRRGWSLFVDRSRCGLLVDGLLGRRRRRFVGLWRHWRRLLVLTLGRVVGRLRRRRRRRLVGDGRSGSGVRTRRRRHRTGRRIVRLFGECRKDDGCRLDGNRKGHRNYLLRLCGVSLRYGCVGLRSRNVRCRSVVVVVSVLLDVTLQSQLILIFILLIAIFRITGFRIGFFRFFIIFVVILLFARNGLDDGVAALGRRLTGLLLFQRLALGGCGGWCGCDWSR